MRKLLDIYSILQCTQVNETNTKSLKQNPLIFILISRNISSPQPQPQTQHCDATLLKLPRITNLVILVEYDGAGQEQMFLYFIENIYISCTIFPRRSVRHFNGKISKYKNKALKPKQKYLIIFKMKVNEKSYS